MARSYHGGSRRPTRRAEPRGALSSTHVQAGRKARAVDGRCRAAGAVREAGPPAGDGVSVPRAGRRSVRVRGPGDRRPPLLRLRRARAGVRGAAAQRLPAARVCELPALPAGRPRHPDRRAGGPPTPATAGSPAPAPTGGRRGSRGRRAAPDRRRPAGAPAPGRGRRGRLVVPRRPGRRGPEPDPHARAIARRRVSSPVSRPRPRRADRPFPPPPPIRRPSPATSSSATR